MSPTAVQLTFRPDIAMDEVQGTLRLARLAAESLHGQHRVEVEAPADVDLAQRRIAIDTASEAGLTLALVFVGYVRHEFGAEAVQITHVPDPDLAAEVQL